MKQKSQFNPAAGQSGHTPRLAWLKTIFSDMLTFFADETAPLNLSAALPGKPVVGRYIGYEKNDVPFPHRFNDAYLLGLYYLYRQTGKEDYLRRLTKIADFLVWSQYNDNGYSPLSKMTNIEWRYGFPDHHFSWKSGDIYEWKCFEPHHHEDCMAVYALIKAFEVTRNNKYLDRCEGWARYQLPRHGYNQGEWRGHQYLWSCYNPAGASGHDAVNNVQSLCSAALAPLGYHTGRKHLLEDARMLLTYLCKEQRADGFWQYHGAEAQEKLGWNCTNFIYNASYMQAQVWEMLIALEYLEQAGISCLGHVDSALFKADEFFIKNGFTKRLAKTPEKKADDGFKHKTNDMDKYLQWVV